MAENCKQFQEIQRIMIRVDGSFLYNFGAALRPLETIRSEQSFLDIIPIIHGAKLWIDAFLNKSIFKPKTSYAKGHALLTLLNEVWDRSRDHQTNAEKIGLDAYNIQEGFRQFETVLTAELGLEDLYLVFQKRGYDNKALIDNATVLFPDELTKKVPEAAFDIEQAGRCIAFELATAAGFHLHRANEAILHRYYDAVTKGADRPGRNIGEYIKALEDLEKKDSGNAKVIAALKSLKDLHRNPLIHPDESLESIDDAIALLNATHSVVVHMLKEIPEPEPEITDPEFREFLGLDSSAEAET